MSKRSRPYTPVRARRDAIVDRHPLDIVRSRVPRLSDFARVSPLSSDLRRFDPERRTRPAPAVLRRAARLVVQPFRPPTYRPPFQVAFADPRKVDLCVRREARKRVMHAKGKAGGKVRRGRRSPWSSISCK